jgi:hypothetical protein
LAYNNVVAIYKADDWGCRVVGVHVDRVGQRRDCV